ncbi:MAG: phosphatidylglycerophosphatase A [Candidatus Omnitrophica bacterium]|nr:phosphatidylglycerophosphatase A [Candidatus Omnitrophota bacterium]
MSSRLAIFLATFFYVGKCPVAPGTLGTLAGLLIAVALHSWPAAYVGVMILVTVLGFLACGPAEKALGKKDPGCIVIDEVAGIMVALFLLPLSWPVIVIGFFLFRAFDMFKIWPANRFENMGGAAGIMLDDLMAGIYTNIVLLIAIRWAMRM